MGEKGLVCVTGAAGFLASWLVKRLLLAGYRVRGTVRDPEDREKVGHLWELEGAAERLELVKADLMVEGSFDEAVRGCEGVFHTASPVVLVKSDPKAEILDPAISGTLNVLKSCKKNPTTRRVVLTSSTSAVRVRPQTELDPAEPLDETSWSSVDLCERLQIWYPLAKLLSEKAAWKFAEENELDLVTVLPSFIVGPSLPRRPCKTVSDVVGLLKGEADAFAWYGRMGYVHIDDVVSCHVLVYEADAAAGRYICNAAVLTNCQLAARLAQRYPWLPTPTRFENPLGVESPSYELDTSKLTSMGFKFRGIEEMFDDVIGSVEELSQRKNTSS
ncbi:dihydroflavonol 4-reductase-like1 [Wolffia australiana]